MASGSVPQSRTSLPRRTLTLENSVAAELAGSGDSVLRALRDRTTSKVHLRGNLLTLEGEDAEMDQAARLVDEMVDLIENGHEVEPDTLDSVSNAIQSSRRSSEVLKDVIWHNRNVKVAPKTVNQKLYVDSIRENTVTFGIGPAGTGKTFLAVAMAAAALVEGEVRRIILTRPAVEAGESLGFLPGDLQAKVDPYLRPLFDALYDMLDPDRVNGYFDRGVIEVAPLAFMRGRTLNDAFVILDEAQNTTPEQMKMFLTRLGFNSKMVVTGDVTQIDLPKERQSGLVVVREILDEVDDVSFVRFGGADVVRHRLVQRIVAAYGEHAEREATQ
jgi:phosphate starvation-inducible protein PhoH and related proteins